jgi:hypothetical protein
MRVFWRDIHLTLRNARRLAIFRYSIFAVIPAVMQLMTGRSLILTSTRALRVFRQQNVSVIPVSG